MRRLTPRQTRLVALCTLAAAALLLATASPAFALSLVPVFALVAALIVGRFPGEELIERLRERRSARGRTLRAPGSFRARPVVYVRPTGRALAFALAMRPPSAAAPAPISSR